MRIQCLQTGVVRERVGTKGVSRYLWAPYRAEALPVNAFLVEHHAGLLLFDTGQTARAARPDYFPRWHPFFRLSRFELTGEDEVAPQLRALGIATGDIRWMVLSHLHTDHIGGMGSFHGPEVLVTRVEWDRTKGFAGRWRGFLPQCWPPGLQPTLLDLDRNGFGPFPGAHDIADDGSLVVVATPGHTPGHASLLVRRPEGSVLLGGDLAHSRADLERDAPAVERYCHDEGIAFTSAHDWDARATLAATQTT